MKDQSCGNCHFYEESNGDNTKQGVCHRYPPVVVSAALEVLIRDHGSTEPDDITTDLFNEMWSPTCASQPPVEPEGWCGEWEPKEPACPPSN